MGPNEQQLGWATASIARKFALAMVLAVLTLAALSAYADSDRMLSALKSFRMPYLWAALALSACSFIVRGFRFQLYLRYVGVNVSHFEALIVFFAGMTMTITPGKIGEVVKSFLLKWSQGTPVATSSPLVVTERVTDLIALLLLSAWGSLVLPAGEFVALGCVLLALIGASLSNSAKLQHRFIRIAQKLPIIRRKAHRLEAVLESLVNTTRIKPLLWGTCLSLAAWYCQVIAVSWIVLGLPDTSITLQASALVYCVPLIAGVVAFMPGGLGVTEVGMAGFIQLVGEGWATPAAAATVTILARGVTLWFAVLVGSVSLAIHRSVTGWRWRAKSAES